MRKIELLAPAKTADIGIEAIKHGADAVYIGASAWGARAAAGNSVEDIERLVLFAHLYKAKVYVTVNTLIFDAEMQKVERLIWQLHDINVDALIVQDLRLLSLHLPPIPLHASTQMDNRTPEKVQRLADLGFPQVVLARELTTEDIAEIHEKCPDTKLEVFVHGALCVCLSGRCNASEALFSRSANRGECAQVCRMAFDLLADGKTVMKDKHLLSLKDNCQIDRLEELLRAGASSLKIEGRLKDADYVKNVTAAYSEALNQLIALHPTEFCRASSGHVNLKFKPDVRRSFNRGFVKDVSQPDANIYTPKAMGEPLTRNTVLHNGDGLCYMEKGKLVGFRVNNVEAFRPMRGVQYFRNQDVEWDKMLSKPSAERKIAVLVTMDEENITMTDEDGLTAQVSIQGDYELAHTHQRENIERQLSKLGDTIFDVKEMNINLKKNYFFPSSLLSRWRRELSDKLTEERKKFYPLERQEHQPIAIETEKPYELTHDKDTPVMICKYCIRRQLGICPKNLTTMEGQGRKPAFPLIGKPQHLALRMANGTTFRLDFDCKNCFMELYLQ
ncbi:MAG: U32 family peptidase [Bacteroidaceae bacterium]|nr:U32 family peptidase [Bacteroidaceae bacterium]